MFFPHICFQDGFWSQNIVFNISNLHRAYYYWFYTIHSMFCWTEFWLKKLKINEINFSFFCGGFALVALFSWHFFELWCLFRLLIPPVPTRTSVSQSGQYSLPSIVNWLLLLQSMSLLSNNVFMLYNFFTVSLPSLLDKFEGCQWVQ